MPRRRTGINRAAAFPLPLPSGGSPVNRLSSHCPVPRPCRQAMLLLFLLAGLPVATVAQKPATPPAVTPAAPSPAPVTPPALTAPVLTQKQMLDGDTRLDRPVTLDVISVPLGEVLQKESLDKSTDKMEDANRFLLTAAPTCADLKLQIRLNKRPLRTLMQALAQMLPGTWTRTRHGYQLAMTKEAVSERAEWWRLFLGEREKALTLQRQAVLAAMQTKGDRRKDSDPDPEQSDRAVETDMADQHDFFQALPPALKEQIAANMDGSGFYEVERMGFGGDMEPAGTIGWLSQMSPQTQETFKTALQDNVNRLAQAPPAYQKYAARAQQDMAALDPSKVYFLFQNGGFVVYATPFNCPMSVSRILDLNVPTTTNTPPLRLDQTELADVVYGGAEMSPQWKRMADAVRKMGDAAPPERKLLAYRVYGMGEAAPPEWKRLAAYQRSRVWPNLLPKLPPDDHSASQVVISRAAQTDWLGEKGHMEYVCDYYSHGGYAMPEDQKKLAVKRPLAAELDEMAARRDVSWTKDADGITLVRNNRWYRDDGLEVPQPLLRRWFGALLQTRREQAARQQAAAQATQGAAQTPPQAVLQSPVERTAAMKQNWDWVAEVFSTLTPWQIRNGLSLFQPEEKDLAPQNDATAAKLYEKLKHYVPPPGGIAPPGYDAYTDVTRRPPFWGAVNVVKGFPHTAQLYGSLDNAGRTALLEGRLPASALSAAQLTQAVSLQPLLPQAMQNVPPDSVFLGLISGAVNPGRVVFGEILPGMRLEVLTPPQNTPPPPILGE